MPYHSRQKRVQKGTTEGKDSCHQIGTLGNATDKEKGRAGVQKKTSLLACEKRNKTKLCLSAELESNSMESVGFGGSNSQILSDRGTIPI